MHARGMLALCLLGWTCIVYAQQAAPGHETKPAFDAVSIRELEFSTRVSSPGSTGYFFAPHKSCVYTDDKVLCQLSIEELIMEAYQRKRYEVSGPKWLRENLFAFQAVLGEKGSKDEARLMIRSALENRFGLRCHVERKPLDVYEIVAAPGGTHLVPAERPENQKRIIVKGAPASTVANSSGSFAAVAISLENLGFWIARNADLDRPVINGTGLDGQYKFDLSWTPSDDSTMTDPGFLDALKKQAGLVLRKQSVPMDILVVDGVNRTPTPN